MEPDTLREMIASGPIDVELNSGSRYRLNPTEAIVSEFEVATLVVGERGLRTALIPIDNIAFVTPAN